jgi:hypothetical protein
MRIKKNRTAGYSSSSVSNCRVKGVSGLKPIQLHDFGPCTDEVFDKFFL